MQLLKTSGFVRLAFIITVLLCSFYFIINYFPEIEFTQLLQSKNNNYIFFALLFVLFHFTLEPLRWFLYLNRSSNTLEMTQAGYPKIFAVMSTVALVSYTMPFKLGLPARLYLLKEFLNLTTPRIIYLLAIDGSINIVTWGLAGVLCLFYIFPFEYLLNHYTFVLIAAISLAIVLYFAAPGLHKLLTPFFIREQRIPAKTIILSFALFVVDIIGFGLRHIVLFYFLGLAIPNHDAFIIGILSIFAGIASTLPMGLGAYDVTLIFLLSKYGVPLEVASLAPLLNRLLNLSTSLIFGGGSLLLLLKNTFSARE